MICLRRLLLNINLVLAGHATPCKEIHICLLKTSDIPVTCTAYSINVHRIVLWFRKPVFFRVVWLASGHSYLCPSVSEATWRKTDRYEPIIPTKSDKAKIVCMIHFGMYSIKPSVFWRLLFYHCIRRPLHSRVCVFSLLLYWYKDPKYLYTFFRTSYRTELSVILRSIRIISVVLYLKIK